MAVERGAAQQGQTVRLRAIFRLAGSLVDPFEIRQVEIRSSSNAVLATFSGASIVRESLGTFYVDWAIADNEPTNIHYDRWFATSTSGAVEEQFTFPFLVLPFSSTTPGASYMTVDQAREFLPEDTVITDPALEYEIALSQAIIERYTGRHFLPITEARLFDGSGRPHLPIYNPILRVSDARILGCCNDGSDALVLNTCSIRITRSRTFLALGNAPRRSHRWTGDHFRGPISLHCCGTWPSGVQNIQITGDWGAYETVPPDVFACMGTLIREVLRCDDPKELPSAEFESESFPGDRTYVLRKVWNNVKLNNGTGYPGVDAVLSRLQRKIMAASV